MAKNNTGAQALGFGVSLWTSAAGFLNLVGAFELSWWVVLGPLMILNFLGVLAFMLLGISAQADK